jgi:hypothetical protein
MIFLQRLIVIFVVCYGVGYFGAEVVYRAKRKMRDFRR